MGGWEHTGGHVDGFIDGTRSCMFDACIPLRMWFGFSEDYRQIIINARQELVLLRVNTNINSIITGGDTVHEPKITITRIVWRMPHILVLDVERLKLLQYVQHDLEIPLKFRCWDLYTYPALPQTNRHIWNVSNISQEEAPRYVIMGFQTDRRNNEKKDSSKFDPLTLRNIKVFLNSQMYPYDELQLSTLVLRKTKGPRPD